jgi:general secretion pathway protein D
VSSNDLVTNKRTISTRVLVDDGGMIVLGGLIEDRLTESEKRVPLLGSIPLLGSLFRTRSTQKTKTNLMVFIRPRILRTAEQAAIETNTKYNYVRNLQMNQNDGKVNLMPGETQPALPPLIGPAAPPIASAPEMPPPPDSTTEPKDPGE